MGFTEFVFTVARHHHALPRHQSPFRLMSAVDCRLVARKCMVRQLHEAYWGHRHRPRRRRKWRCRFVFPLSLSVCPPAVSINFVISLVEEEVDEREVEMVEQPREE